MTLTRISQWDYLAESSDIIDNSFPDLGTIGARVYVTDTRLWYVVKPDFTLAILTNPNSSFSQNSGALAYDAFGRQRVSDTGNRWDIEFIYDKQSILVDEVTTGAATATHNANTRDVNLAIVDTVDGTSKALYSHYDIPYTAGNSQLIDTTAVLDLADLGTGVAEVFLRTSITGSVQEQSFTQDQWDSNQTGLNWNYSHIFNADFQSLKVGRIRYTLVQNGEPVMIKEIYNDNLRNSGYWQRPTLPQYWRIYNDATYTYCEMGYGDTTNAIGLRYKMPKNANATMRAICGTVKSEGGDPILKLNGLPFSISTRTTQKTISTNFIPILSIRMASTFNGFTNRGLGILKSFGIYVDNPVNYRILYRPILTNASWVSVDSNSFMEYDISATAISGGIPIKDDIVFTGRNETSASRNILGKTLMSLGRTGTADIVTIGAIRVGSVNAVASASLDWEDIR